MDDNSKNCIFNEVSTLYHEYYDYAIKKRKWLEVPKDLEHREIGYGMLKKVDNRNISFTNEIDYLSWVLKEAPFHLYKSLSYMEHPSLIGGATKKGIFKREIAFDIDTHKTKYCSHDDSWICEECLNEAKNQVLILSEDFLFPDFGLTKNDLKIVFTGNRGYHVYLEPEDESIKNRIESWGKDERRYFIEYILGKNMNLRIMGNRWKIRLLKEFEKNKIGIKKFEKTADWKTEIDTRKDDIRKKIYEIIHNMKSRLELDEKVMDDDIRLLRTIGSLHGYTGLMVKEIAYDSLKNGQFDPLNHAVFSKFHKKRYSVKINQEVFQLTLKGEIFDHESKEIPASYLLFLFGHGIDFEIL
ncbi:putative DNA primase, small subunit [Methanococcus vannielii SB]|uniref:DNA primase small subunit PriS n=1 Tax=Methanococcus vannielii (strain ATCC 35089 / DSM 1224 / JCM 13029 / OCM 148 / SB) TaxID=406327 RepID=A6UR62_METVS|nr:DNA primase catalytic subunit PriS [Methanococcus vannielii]ABR54984.1 putative DNA primase, small subunit [Methanococcus vannielii SB]